LFLFLIVFHIALSVQCVLPGEHFHAKQDMIRVARPALFLVPVFTAWAARDAADEVALDRELQSGLQNQAGSIAAEDSDHGLQEAASASAVHCQHAMQEARAALLDMRARHVSGRSNITSSSAEAGQAEVQASSMSGVATKAGVLAMVAEANEAIEAAKDALQELKVRKKRRRKSVPNEPPEALKKEDKDVQQIGKALDEMSSEAKNAEQSAQAVDHAFKTYDSKLEVLGTELGQLTSEAHSYRKQIFGFFEEAENERYSPLAKLQLELQNQVNADKGGHK